MQELLEFAEQDMSAFPGTRLEDWKLHWRDVMQYERPQDQENLYDSLLKAGLPP